MNRLLTYLCCFLWFIGVASAQFNGTSGIYALNNMTFGVMLQPLTIISGGTSYSTNDVLTLDCGDTFVIGTKPTVTVTSVSAGTITGISLTTPGFSTKIPSTGQAGQPNGVCNFSTTGGSGFGAVIYGAFGFNAATLNRSNSGGGGGGGSPGGNIGDLQTNAGGGAFGAITPSSGVNTALPLSVNVASGFATLNGSITAGHCLTWGPGIADAGAACNSGGGGSFLPLSGGTLTGELNLTASTTGASGLNLAPGTAPTSPVNGDLWTTSTGVFSRVNGATVGPFAASGGAIPLTVTDSTHTVAGVGSITVNGAIVSGTSPNAIITTSAAGLPTAIYSTHALLISGVTTPAGPFTVTQQGFYASGDGGAITYNWNASSFCAGNTTGSPATAAGDGIVCILPSGQAKTSPGRYLIQPTNPLDVRAVGMAPGGQDNAPFISALMLAQAPVSGLGYDVNFNGVVGTPTTTYYFSQAFVNYRNANYHCTGAATSLLFAPSADGFIEEDGENSPDGQSGGGKIEGCRINQLGSGIGFGDPHAPNTITTATFGFPVGGVGGTIPTPSWHIGDGIIAYSGDTGFYPSTAVLTVPIGTTVTNVVGTTLTLSGSGIVPAFGNSNDTKATATFTQTSTNNFSQRRYFTCRPKHIRLHDGQHVYRSSVLG